MFASKKPCSVRAGEHGSLLDVYIFLLKATWGRGVVLPLRTCALDLLLRKPILQWGAAVA